MRSRFLVSVGAADLLSLLLSLVLASELVLEVPLPWMFWAGARVFPMLGFMVGSLVVMSLATARMSGPGVPRPTYARMVTIFIGSSSLTALLIVLLRTYWSRPYLAVTGAFWLVLASTVRLILRRRPWTERIAVITAEKQLAEELAASPHAMVETVLDPKFEGPVELPDRDVTLAVDLRAVLSERAAQFLASCDIAGYAIRPFTSTYEDHTGRVPLVHLAEGWEISAPLLHVGPWLPGKRVFDIVVVLLTAPLWLLLGLGVGIYIRITSGRPVIFSQRRIGLGGQPFTMYKFRTMDIDAEKNGPRFATEDDERLTKGGKFLRKTRLDEIPQLWNVLRGDMSLVGPRAEQVPFVRMFRRQIPFYEHRHLVRPGVTGWAQVSYGYADDQADTMEKLTYDLYYIKHMSPAMDLRVLAKSVWTVLTGDGAR